MPSLVAPIKNVGWSFEVNMYNAKGISLSDCSDLVEDSDSVNNYSCLGSGRTKIPSQTRQCISNPASTRLFVERVTKLLHCTTLILDLAAQFL